MKIPRDVDAKTLIKALNKIGFKKQYRSEVI
ncbi:MAG: hypothetical protein BWY38_02448 [Ignavibacteria bacterium ADurb.Bin266]|nr:MAG: hypothetical protein BWY38_02448 [Ignavibacteria bacterium ADurb.Bin266]